MGSSGIQNAVPELGRACTGGKAAPGGSEEHRLSAWVQIPVQHFPGCVALCKVLNLSGPSFPHLPNGEIRPTPQYRLNKGTFIQPLGEQLLE